MNVSSLTIAFTLAWRNLWRNYRRTLIMLLAIGLGVWAMVFMTAMMRGMVDGMLKDGIRALPGHVQIHHPNYLDDPSVANSIAEPQGTLLDALNHPQVDAWAMRVKVPAVISSERETRGVMLLGVDAAAELNLSFDISHITQGQFLPSLTEEELAVDVQAQKAAKGIVIGVKLAQKLETRLGKRIVVMTQDIDNTIVDRGFRIVGLYQSDIPGFEEMYVYSDRRLIQSMVGLKGQVSEIAINGDGYRDNQALLSHIANASPADMKVESWRQVDAYLSAMLEMMDGFVLVWIVVIFLALSFGLMNTLIMAVFERVREIGLMQALGMRSSGVMRMILIESLLLLLLGLAAGNICSLLSIAAIQDGIDVTAVAEGMAMFGAKAVLYPVLQYSDMLLANVVVIVLGLLTSLYPAWRAAHYDPIVALNKH
ncbi:ABC transporter permease [Shewanella gelidii]|uniref:ABC transporter permease n=1 Tax=Shewanella gelidii TaxID=1642821 RepID=A0A917N917_9GAMM|nr:FtsX-like permease family protein [Shewanella gelidii]MCL1097895.1 ABC transporter permease [Shewanella gelidii]GGI77904.1 ABC transporter permease [Shewanella gelidii]